MHKLNQEGMEEFLNAVQSSLGLEPVGQPNLILNN